MRVTRSFRDSRRAPLLQVLKSALASVLAWVLATVMIGGQPPVFAAIAALLVVQPSVTQSFSKGIERSIGVVTGVIIASVLAFIFGSAWWVIALAVTGGLLLAWALRMTAGTANQIGISALLVIALGTTTPEYAVDRVIETVLGVVIGFAVNVLIIPPVAVEPARRDVEAWVRELARRLEGLATALRTEPDRVGRIDLLLTARLLRPMGAKAETTITSAEDSLALNPRGRRRREQLSALRDVVDTLSPVVTQVIGMTRTYADLAEPGLSTDPSVRAIAERLDRAAHDVERLVAAVPTAPAAAMAEEMVDEPTALTRPLTVLAPDPDHWILVGSLLVDLERIRQSLTGDRA